MYTLCLILCLVVINLAASERSSYDNWISRIVGGREIEIEEAPYQVALFTKYLFNLYIFKCGGSILTSKFVISAAHCYEPDADFYIQSGSTFLKGENIIKVEKAIPHPEYDSNNSLFDFMLLKLNTNLKFNSKVQPVQLPYQNMELPLDHLAVVSGWGRTAHKGHISKHLKAVEVPLRDAELCYSVYKHLTTPMILNTSVIVCAGSPFGGKDSCQGDSGGPLVFEKHLIGVVSFGYGCADANYPGVYSKVAAVLDWIQLVLS